jgi:Flp pilus assembly protein TadG
MSFIRKVSRPHDERGISIVIVAIVMVAMLSIAAVVIDLGQAYSDRRKMQNSADAAAVGATRALQKARKTGLATCIAIPGPCDAVDSTASDVATKNGSQAAMVTCQVIRWNYYSDNSQIIAPCSPSSGWRSDVTNGGPAGVLVKVGTVTQAAFGAIIGQRTTTERASAAASIQPLRSAKGPFILCGAPLADDGWDLLNADGSFNAVKATALGTFPLQESQQKSCHGPAAFKGKAEDAEAVFDIPGIDVGANGNGFDSDIQGVVLGATPCTASGEQNCDLAIPIADSTDNYNFHITDIAVFHVTGDGSANPKYFAKYISTLDTAAGGRGGTGVCSVGALCLVKLIA